MPSLQTDMRNMTDKEIHSVSNESLLEQALSISVQNIDLISSLPEANYFLELIRAYNSPAALAEKKPKVIVMGTDFPGEIIHALTGKPPYWVIGGNNAFTSASDDDVPRDTDPVTRAALGQLLVMDQAKDSALVVIPCSSDAQRKAAYFLEKHGWRVVTLWIPAVKDEATHKGFVSELEHAIRKICCHVGKRYSAFALNCAVKQMNEIRNSIHAFLDAARTNEQMLQGSLRMAVLDSFFMTDNVEEWHEHLKKRPKRSIRANR